MDARVYRAESHRNPQDYSEVSELQVLSDIQYFQDQLAELPVDDDPYNRARRHVYVTLLQQRRRLLAATRAGRPADWPEFN
ncbi:hypothetical protein [Natronospira bacteriovora]|uniref:Uncharacterized protein n=1 Tax=Natronospira bacteriovora TaxID=3069753 RepID=A0ABU0W924_9GAMM|nr:hypothetical protein [Natronospira sp. AB-CW4]MDQ2070258.1 hypothetical protein [Natronospira sp. AB-CW4]